MSKLLSPIKIAGLELKNRIVMPPMCMYEVQKKDGIVTPFHRIHYGQRAIGGVGLIIVEATAVEPEGRLTNLDLGLWNDEQTPGFKALVSELKEFGCKTGVQIGHGGRKSRDAKLPLAPSAIPFSGTYRMPKEMTPEDIKRIQESFSAAARRAQEAGVDMIELHGAHGYLINQFLEPASNRRRDGYGGDIAGRYRFLKELVQGIRPTFSGSLWVRLSVSAYHPQEQNSLEDYIQIGRWLKQEGVDCLDISSGGVVDRMPDSVYPGYQTAFSAKIKAGAAIPVTAVGLLHDPALAEFVLQNNMADLVEIGRALISRPNWPTEAAAALGDKEYRPYNESYKRGQNT